MTRQNSRLLLGVGLTVALLLTAGCMGLATGDPDPEEIATQMENRHDNIDSIEGVQVRETTGLEQESRTTTEILEIPDEGEKRVVTSSTAKEWNPEGMKTLRTEGESKHYDPDENTVTTYEHDMDTNLGVGNGFDADQIEEVLNRSDVSYEGTDTVADRDVHVITLEDTESEQQSTVTAYVDQEFWYPLQYESTYEGPDGNAVETTMYFETVTFNGEVSAADLELDIPDDATETEAQGPETEEYDTIESVQDAAPFEITDPELPADCSFESAMSFEMDESVSYTLTYTSGEDSVTYSLTDRTERELSGEEVDLDGTTGYLTEHDEFTSLTWKTDETIHTLYGLDREEAITAANSVLS